MFDVEGRAEPVELMPPRRGPFSQAKEAVGERLSGVCKNRADAHRAGTLQVAQEAPGVGGGPGLADADEARGSARSGTPFTPTGRPIKGDEEVAALRFTPHVRHVFHVDVEVAGRMGLEGAVMWLGGCGLHVPQVAHPMTAQTAVQAGA